MSVRPLSSKSGGLSSVSRSKTKEKRFYKTMIPKADALYDEHLKTLQAQPKP